MRLPPRRRPCAFVAFAAVAALAACSPTTTKTGGLGLDGPEASPTTPAALSGLGLPSANNAAPLDPGRTPVVSVAGSSIALDGVVVGDARALLQSGRLQRVDGLLEALRTAREQWKAQNSGKTFPGAVLIGFDKAAPAFLVKSVFQTAAFAGFPNAAFAVRGKDGAVGRLDVDAVLPLPLAKPVPSGSRLVVTVTQAKLTLVWHKGGDVVATTEVGSTRDPTLFDRLAGRVEKEWPLYATHRESGDQALDQAVLYVPDDLDYADLVAIIDAIEGVRRELDLGGLRGRVAALNVSLSVAKEPPGNRDPRRGGSTRRRREPAARDNPAGRPPELRPIPRLLREGTGEERHALGSLRRQVRDRRGRDGQGGRGGRRIAHAGPGRRRLPPGRLREARLSPPRRRSRDGGLSHRVQPGRLGRFSRGPPSCSAASPPSPPRLRWVRSWWWKPQCPPPTPTPQAAPRRAIP